MMLSDEELARELLTLKTMATLAEEHEETRLGVPLPVVRLVLATIEALRAENAMLSQTWQGKANSTLENLQKELGDAAQVLERIAALERVADAAYMVKGWGYDTNATGKQFQRALDEALEALQRVEGEGSNATDR